MTRIGSILLSLIAIFLVYLAVSTLKSPPVPNDESAIAPPAEESFRPDSPPEANESLPEGHITTTMGPTTMTAIPDPARPSGVTVPFDPDSFDYPARAGQLGKLGDFEEREVRVFQHPDGSVRVHRLLETAMKYPFVLVKEVYSGESGALARQSLSVGDHLMVQFVSGTERSVIEAAVQDAGFTVRKWFQQPGLVLVEIPDAGIDSLEESLGKISTHPQIEFAERDDLVFAD
jgi:hypothetical protein